MIVRGREKSSNRLAEDMRVFAGAFRGVFPPGTIGHKDRLALSSAWEGQRANSAGGPPDGSESFRAFQDLLFTASGPLKADLMSHEHGVWQPSRVDDVIGLFAVR